MQHVPLNKAEGHKGQITQNAIELQVLFRATHGSLLSAVFSINIHAVERLIESSKLE